MQISYSANYQGHRSDLNKNTRPCLVDSGGYWVRRSSRAPLFTLIEGPPFLKMPRVVIFFGILRGFMNLKNSQKFGVFSK